MITYKQSNKQMRKENHELSDTKHSRDNRKTINTDNMCSSVDELKE